MSVFREGSNYGQLMLLIWVSHFFMTLILRQFVNYSTSFLTSYKGRICFLRSTFSTGEEPLVVIICSNYGCLLYLASFDYNQNPIIDLSSLLSTRILSFVASCGKWCPLLVVLFELCIVDFWEEWIYSELTTGCRQHYMHGVTASYLRVDMFPLYLANVFHSSSLI